MRTALLIGALSFLGSALYMILTETKTSVLCLGIVMAIIAGYIFRLVVEDDD